MCHMAPDSMILRVGVSARPRILHFGDHELEHNEDRRQCALCGPAKSVLRVFVYAHTSNMCGSTCLVFQLSATAVCCAPLVSVFAG